MKAKLMLFVSPFGADEQSCYCNNDSSLVSDTKGHSCRGCSVYDPKTVLSRRFVGFISSNPTRLIQCLVPVAAGVSISPISFAEQVLSYLCIRRYIFCRARHIIPL